MMKTIRVSDKGQIAIPQPMRTTLGIERGDDLIVIQLDNKILLEKAQKVEQNMKDDFKDILKFSEQSLKEVWDNKEDDIWNQYMERKKCK
jgi:AbrB family looped-hinge helix DNA binding protein